MHDDRWWGWAALIVVFLVIRLLQTLFRRGKRAQPNEGLARMNAAAERILKERGAAPAQGAANPIPRTTSAPAAGPRAKRTPQPASMQVRRESAVMRRGPSVEPVVRRRH